MNENKNLKLIHIAKILSKNGKQYLFLKEIDSNKFGWFLANGNHEENTKIIAESINEALRLGHNIWKNNYFTTLNCGFRYTLPERDEHGTNALFFQMAASYNSPNGVYFDQELGSNCIVHQASIEARQFLNLK